MAKAKSTEGATETGTATEVQESPSKRRMKAATKIVGILEEFQEADREQILTIAKSSLQ